ncbi:MAG: tyrosine-type recombinase/integrase [Thaumarchaeota archaeon]|nr:tyrosine-type recombinase/integrase [Nitrososphaerota archaeon]
MKAKPDIHNYQKRLHDALNGLEASKLPDEDKQLIERFTDVLRAQGISLGRVAKYIYQLKTLSMRLGEIGCKGLKHANTERIGKLCVWLNECNQYTPHTKRDFIITLKRFFQWLRAPPDEYVAWRRKKKYPAEVEDLSTNLKHNEKVLPADLLNENDTRQLLTHANHPMVRAFLSLSDEVGPRVGESLGMRMKDIIFDGSDVLCRLRGKTGERQIYIIKSVSMISQWLDIHPLREDPETPLWINLSNYNRYEQWSYSACVKTLDDLARKAELRKRIYPHLFRHSAASRDAKLGFTEVQLCLKYGWVLGSDMPRIYIHLANTALKQKIMETYAGTEVEKPKPQSVRCPRCSAQNQPSQNYCYTCGAPLIPGSKSIEMEELRHEVKEIKKVLQSLLREKA